MLKILLALQEASLSKRLGQARNQVGNLMNNFLRSLGSEV